MQWDKITDIVLVASFAVLGVLGVLGVYQWITRKSLKKVDRELVAMIPSLALMALVYVVFDKFIVLATRPDGSGESSFPSTHVMVVATIFLLAGLALPKYIKNKWVRIVIDVMMVGLVVLTAVGRVLANKHWPADVIGGVVFAAAFAGIYLFIVKFKRKGEKDA